MTLEWISKILSNLPQSDYATNARKFSRFSKVPYLIASIGRILRRTVQVINIFSFYSVTALSLSGFKKNLVACTWVYNWNFVHRYIFIWCLCFVIRVYTITKKVMLIDLQLTTITSTAITIITIGSAIALKFLA